MIAPRWLLWTSGIGLLALAILLPLRVALDLAGLDRLGFTARQVAGTIWYGRIGNLTLRSQDLGTFDVSVGPTALLLARLDMRFRRLDELHGALTGSVRSGWGVRGIEKLTGSITASQLFAPLPVARLDFQDTTILFRGGTCRTAEGTIVARLAVPASLAAIAGDFRGPVTCEGERVRAQLSSVSGRERIEFTVAASGRYRAWISVRRADLATATALRIAGFRDSPDGLSLSASNQL